VKERGAQALRSSLAGTAASSRGWSGMSDQNINPGDGAEPVRRAAARTSAGIAAAPASMTASPAPVCGGTGKVTEGVGGG